MPEYGTAIAVILQILQNKRVATATLFVFASARFRPVIGPLSHPTHTYNILCILFREVQFRL